MKMEYFHMFFFLPIHKFTRQTNFFFIVWFDFDVVLLCKSINLFAHRSVPFHFFLFFCFFVLVVLDTNILEHALNSIHIRVADAVLHTYKSISISYFCRINNQRYRFSSLRHSHTPSKRGRCTGFSGWFCFTCFSKSHKSIPYQQFQLRFLLQSQKLSQFFSLRPTHACDKNCYCARVCVESAHMTFEMYERSLCEINTECKLYKAIEEFISPPISRRANERETMNWWHCCPLFMIICGSGGGGDTHFPSVCLSYTLSMIYGVSDLNALMNVCIQRWKSAVAAVRS